MAGYVFQLTGQSDVNRRLNEALKGMDRSCAASMHKAVLMVRREATPLTPIKNGDLRRSMYTEVYRDGSGGFSGEIGYTMAYAPYVHEINKNYKAPGTQWKFLETALLRKATDIMKLFGSELDLTKVMRNAQQASMSGTGSLADFSEQFGFIG